jgi:hypothetical protein
MAITTLYLAAHWRLMGALEALNGMLLFGLTTAFLYGLIQRVWPVELRVWHRQERRKDRPFYLQLKIIRN